MYENNYNYIEEKAPETKEKKSSVKKNIAMVLAVVVLGGASGFGGAYLQSRVMSDDSVSVSADASADRSETAAASPASSDDNKSTSTPVSSLMNTSSNKGGVLTTEQIVEKVSPSVVSVHSEFDNGSGTGTGIIMSSDGYIITNAHVVQADIQEYVQGSGKNGSSGNNGYGYYFNPYDFFFGGGNGYSGGTYQTVTKNANTVTVYLSNDDTETEYTAEIIGADADSDLAVLKIDAENLCAAEFGNSDELTMGSRAVAIGYPMGLGLSTSEGIISGLNRELSVELTSGGSASMTLIQTDAAINPGNSGGPLINEYGQVVGITSSKLASSSVEGLGFAIPITDAMPLINDLMNQGYVSNHTPQLGITGSNLTSALIRYYKLPVDSGVMVLSVAEGSGAAEAGLSEGDIIIAADGKPVENMDDLTAAKDGKAVGDTITLTLARKDGNEDVTVTLTEINEAPDSVDN
ncbi:MAG: trypsin-like peptidase domain-containing protein [Oscillospiraceae bacterium]|nr:trypsin-like peptidase domain-containing protein [Oscillospiraceae bacterium]